MIAHRHVLRQQAGGLRFAQRLGGDDVAAGGQHFAAQLRVEAVEVGVAGQHQGLGAHVALGGVHLDLGAVVDARHFGVLKQLHAQLLRGGRFAERQVQRVQMARAHVDHAAHIAVGADHAAHLVGLQQAHFMAITQAAQFFGVFGQAVQVAGLVGEVAVAPGQVAGDLVALDALAHDLHGFQAHQLHLAHAVAADHVGELVQAVADAANQLAAITPAGAPADLARFQQHHAEAALGQFQGRVQPGKAAADHAHVGSHFAGQRRVIGLRQAAGGVVGSGVPGAGGHGEHPCLENLTQDTAVGRSCLRRAFCVRIHAYSPFGTCFDELQQSENQRIAPADSFVRVRPRLPRLLWAGDHLARRNVAPAA